VRDIENASQVIQDNLNYDGFGNVTESNSSVGDRYKYTAREFDANTGLQYNGARYYNPATGRWQGEDPIGLGAQESNLYRYVGNAPTNAVDPSGLVPERPPKGRKKPTLKEEVSGWIKQLNDRNFKKRRQAFTEIAKYLTDDALFRVVRGMLTEQLRTKFNNAEVTKSIRDLLGFPRPNKEWIELVLELRSKKTQNDASKKLKELVADDNIKVTIRKFLIYRKHLESKKVQKLIDDILVQK
jgi:RHS repeat-associated protein